MKNTKRINRFLSIPGLICTYVRATQIITAVFIFINWSHLHHYIQEGGVCVVLVGTTGTGSYVNLHTNLTALPSSSSTSFNFYSTQINAKLYHSFQTKTLYAALCESTCLPCLICHLGKTTCLNLYTGHSLPTGDSAQSVTGTTVAVKDLNHGDAAPQWVDNPGSPPTPLMQSSSLLFSPTNPCQRADKPLRLV